MAVDHGLGGKESEKHRSKRDRKAKRLRILNKSLQNKDLVGNSKKEVVFDEDARVAFLTGFHKRKQERRKFGLTMQVSCFPRVLLLRVAHYSCVWCRC